ncbi:MAG TPA: acyl carrier protein [Gammaproteobacteria bacterium]|nr:acyl carrier protein [Gammaproteobacteria bacterium]
MTDKETVFTEVRNVMVELFELDPNNIRLDSMLYEDLDLDSIDAVDLIVKLQRYTGKKIPPDEFKMVKTVGDVVDAVANLLGE